MSPQNELSGSASAPQCVEVRLVMDAVRDGRATSVERAYMNAHLDCCAECASAWAFLKATKMTWSQTPLQMPPSSLSARIAAATYRKPTFAERFVAVFAFLQPIPVRVAVGVAAVAGVAFLTVPRMEMPMVADSSGSVAKSNTTVTRQPVETVEPTAKKSLTTPVVAKAVVKKSSTKEVASVAPTVSEISHPLKSTTKMVAVVSPAPVSKSIATPLVKKSKPVQIAQAHLKPMRQIPVAPVESSLESPSPNLGEASSPVEVATNTAPNTSVEKVHPKELEPAARPPATVTGITVADDDPNFANGSTVIKGLANTNRHLMGSLQGGVAIIANNSPTVGIVSAPVGSRR